MGQHRITEIFIYREESRVRKSRDQSSRISLFFFLNLSFLRQQTEEKNASEFQLVK